MLVLINADFSALTLSRGRAALTATSLRTRTGRHTSNTLSLILIQWFRVLATSPLQSAQTSYAHSHTSSSQNMMLAARFTHTHTHFGSMWICVSHCLHTQTRNLVRSHFAHISLLSTVRVHHRILCSAMPPAQPATTTTTTTNTPLAIRMRSKCGARLCVCVCVCVCVVPANNLHAVGFVQHSPKGNNNALGLSLSLSLSLSDFCGVEDSMRWWW